jgi:hypothetical protein
MKLIRFVTRFLFGRNRVSNQLIISGFLFLVLMSLDFYVTNIFSYGDYALEGNFLARLWWQISGDARYIEIPIWVVAIFGTAYVINSRSQFLALLWIDFLAINHLFGFLTWLPSVNINYFYSIVKYDWATGYLISLASILIAIPIALLQLKLVGNEKTHLVGPHI